MSQNRSSLSTSIPPASQPFESEQALKNVLTSFRAGKFLEAEQTCAQVLSSEPGNVFARQLLAAICSATGRPERAIVLYREVLRDEPSSFESLNALAAILRSIGQVNESIELCRQAVAVEPDDAAGHNNLGLSLLAARQMDEAVTSFQTAVSLAPTLAILYYNLGTALQHQGLDGQAELAYRRAIELNPSSAQPYSRLGQILTTRGDRNGAKDCFRQAFRADPGSARSHVSLAQLLIEEGALADAEKHLRKAIALEPGLGSAYAVLGILLQDLGRFEEAIASFEATLRLRPGQVGPMFGIAYSRKFTESDRATLQTMADLLKEGRLSAREQSYLHYSLGKAHDDLAEFEPAMDHFVEANELELGLAKRRFDPDAYAAKFASIRTTFTQDFMRARSDWGSRSQRPIFIVGMMRSGTTLVEQILSAHPEVGAGGELSFWPKEGAAALAEAHSGNLSNQTLVNLADEYLRVLGQLSPGKTHVTDKLPTNFMLLGLIRLAFPNAKVIHCRRHPVDTCLSIFVTPYTNAPDYAYDRDNIVFAYRQYLRTMAHWRVTLPPDGFLEIDYEELVSHREVASRRLVEFCDLPWDERCLQPEKNQRSVTTPTTWSVRQPVYQTSIERWRRYEPWLGPLRALLEEASGV
jgi:tetratricopeptide (TPR) repeat protein